jgi:hypothetical protein
VATADTASNTAATPATIALEVPLPTFRLRKPVLAPDYRSFHHYEASAITKKRTIALCGGVKPKKSP